MIKRKGIHMNDNNDVKHLQLFSEERDITWIRIFTCFVAGLSHCLNRNYVIDSTQLSGWGGVNSYNYRDNYDIVDKKAYEKRIKYLRKYGSAEQLSTLENLPEERARGSKANAANMEKIRTAIREVGLELKETVTRTTENSGSFRGGVDETFDQHAFTIAEKTVTPEVFRTVFRDVYDRYEQLKNLEEIKTIASDLSQPVIRCHELYIKGLQFLFKHRLNGSEICAASPYITADHKLVGSKSLMFKSLGMANLPDWNKDFATYAAVGIAILEKIFNYTMKDGQYVLDIGLTRVSSTNDSAAQSWHLQTFAFPLRYLIDNYEEYPGTLKQW